MVVAKQSYEDSRRKRVEENKKRMEALNLPLLSQALKTSPKPSPTKQAKPRVVQKQLVVVRRSTRFANKPAPIYKEVAVDRVAIPRRILGRQRNLSNLVLASPEAIAEADEKAEKLVLGLPPGYPILTRSMQPSHVAGGFWLGLPVDFCKLNLPSRDDVMTLIDEDGDEYPTIYLARKRGLSGGWKGFAVAHHLVHGDAVVFQLIGRTTFKVYIIRVNGSEEGNNGAN
ncbi:B3 domain-containing protein At5g42700 [Quercus suber]|uniref:B3 domain-containing protein n=1 Tax=Quercus suber TaxID=58331 RepID=A0AAW0MB58_QUESU|nr:B3 domain-containing protein At5g42700-like [Quercus suber]POE71244.1 b3 domain-containing protein [Quercus suber]